MAFSFITRGTVKNKLDRWVRLHGRDYSHMRDLGHDEFPEQQLYKRDVHPVAKPGRQKNKPWLLEWEWRSYEQYIQANPLHPWIQRFRPYKSGWQREKRFYRFDGATQHFYRAHMGYDKLRKFWRLRNLVTGEIYMLAQSGEEVLLQ